ncbi:MAG: DUF3301 domain-containing protein [Gammaproteobacteria bacterium]
MGDILFIILIVSAVGYWWDTQRCNEIALLVCRKKCAAASLQLLDATVIRQRTWLRKGPAGLQICRLYSFEYSADLASDFGQREQGYVVLIGKQVVETSMPYEEAGKQIH